jgi:hypothetical protein
VDVSDCLFRLTHITAMAEALFRNEEKARCWLCKVNAELSGESPMAMLSIPATWRGEEMLFRRQKALPFETNDDEQRKVENTPASRTHHSIRQRCRLADKMRRVIT